jgi:Zn-dependent M28 family amino/carboxypeptidase
MEALRILKAAGLQPRRTIRAALWTGEEQDYYGSVGYVAQHFGDVKTGTLKADAEPFSVYFNLDNGAGRIRGVNLQGNEPARPILRAWLEPFAYLGVDVISSINTGGTDHMAFDAVGLPGFQFIQHPLNYSSQAHHSTIDTYEQVIPDDAKQMAVVLASVAYHAAMRDERFPRK